MKIIENQYDGKLAFAIQTQTNFIAFGRTANENQTFPPIFTVLIKTNTLFQFYFEYCWRFNNILPIGFEIGHANLFSKWMQMRCCAHKMMNLINLANIEHITTCSQKKNKVKV